MRFHGKMTIRELYAAEELSSMQGNWISSVNDQWALTAMDKTLEDIHTQNPTWGLTDMLSGINRVSEVALSGQQFVFPVYTEKEICASPDKVQTQLIFLPAEDGKKEGFIILLAGGAYGAVCSLPEALPAAAELNKQGYSCFCLNYRTASQESFEKGLMPKPLEDVAAALRFIRDKEDLFGVNPDRYLIGGFSAGGHAAAMWGTMHQGARHYHLPQPKGLLLAYPMVSSELFPESPMVNWIKQGMYGKEYTKAEEQSYSVDRHIDSAYPPVYLVRATDDDTVPDKHHENLMLVLNNKDVRVCLEEADNGGHGFGAGSDTPLKGWLQRAAEFLYGTERETS